MEVADGRNGWRPGWAVDPTRTVGIIALPARPHPTALLLDVRSLDALLATLARMRGAMAPAPVPWRVDPALRRLRSLLLRG
jgi:hypothetical protein